MFTTRSNFPEYDTKGMTSNNAYELDHAVGIAALLAGKVDAIVMIWSDLQSTKILS